MITKLEKIDKLKGAIQTLKEEFTGLDSILDQLQSLMIPWYVTPEVIERPQVISLWGMTGTGKTSVVRRLLELLGLTSKSLFFDCGTEDTGGETNIATKISDYVDSDDYGNSRFNLGDTVFVFDEFQYARTIDESGYEISKSSLRPIWNLLDNGLLHIPENSWESSRFISYYEDISNFSREHPDIHLEHLEVKEPEEVRVVLENLGLLYFDRGIPGLYTGRSKFTGDHSEETSTTDPYSPLRILEQDIFRIIFKKLTRMDNNLYTEIRNNLLEAKTVSEMVSILHDILPYIMETKTFDCSGSLIFILGNLDEAFSCHSEVTPDIDADLFFDETSKVTISDIKESLKRRFRAEQIARFGNSIIKYPTLGKASFKEIIRKEILRLCSRFTESTRIHVMVDPSFEELIYQEGVYPTQGVRPVFTTIGVFLIPLFSRILIALESKENKSEYSVLICGPEDYNFKKDQVTIKIKYSDIFKENVSLPLILGPLRNPGNRKTLYINSVHESGHAIVYSWLTGNIPNQIVAVSTDRGGFCTTYDKNRASEIKTRKDIENRIMVGLAGYLAEQLVYGEDPEKLLCGSYSDLQESWEDLSDVVYRGGYFDPVRYTAREVESNGDGIPKGFSDSEIQGKTRMLFEELKGKTIEILKSNKLLLADMSLKLSESGALREEDCLELIKKNTGTLTLSRLEEAKKECSYEWYYDKLRSIVI